MACIGLCALLITSAGPVNSAARGGARLSWPGKIAYIGNDGNIHTCTGRCDQPVCVTCSGKEAQVRIDDGLVPAALEPELAQETAPQVMPVHYDLPTFSPDGSRLAYVSSRLDRDGPLYGIHVSKLATNQAVQLSEEPMGAPIYMAWTPDQRRLFFLLAQDSGLSLMLQQTDKPGPTRLLLSGQPLFFAWSQARGELAINYAPTDNPDAARVVLMRVTDRDQRIVKVLSNHPAMFRTPAWSPDGSHLAWMEDNGHGQAVLMVAGADGAGPQSLVGLPPGLVSFVWAPDSRHIAFTAGAGQGAMAYDGVGLLDLPSGKITTIVDGPVTSYSFSPDSRWLAYVSPQDQGNTWNVVRLDGTRRRRLASVAITENQSRGLRYFDQFALSATEWSPDSNFLTFAGALLPDTPPAQPQPLPPPSIWVLPVGGGQAEEIANGSLSLWMPAPRVAGK